MEMPEAPDQLEDGEVLKRCYKCEHDLLDNLNIVYNAPSSLIVIWNRFQIFVYEDLNFDNTAKLFVPEFQVRQLIIANNYLVCLDTSGNIHTTSMKFKNPAQKRFKSSFQPREQNVLCWYYAEDHVMSVRNESDQYFLCQNKVNSDFHLDKKIKLICKGRWPLPRSVQGKCLLTAHKLIENEMEYVGPLFNVRNNKYSDCSLVLISFDKLTVYGCLFSPKMPEEDIVLVKLYTCPSEMCNFEVVRVNDAYVLIGLNMGTLIRLSLKRIADKPELVHLNTALHKFVTLKDTIIYTDGRSMWKTDNTFTEIKFYQFFVRHVKDFIKFGDQIICTTFTDLIYVFPIDDDSSFIKPQTVDEYCAAEKLLNNSEYLHKIVEELEKNNELTKKINEEGNFVTAFSLSNRQDIMNNIIKHSVTVYDQYEDVKLEHTDILLTENISEYFDPDSIQILVNFHTTSLQHMFNNTLSNIFNDVKIHISLSTENKLLKTTSVKMGDALKKINILIPVDISRENISEINVNLEMLSSVPGALDGKKKLWVTLYRQKVVLNAEHFIKTATVNNYIPKVNESVEDLVLNVGLAHYGDIYKFTDIKKHNLVPEFSVYLKLPQDYTDILLSDICCTAHMNKKKASEFMKIYTSEEFVRAKSNIAFEIGDKRVKAEILCNEFTNPLLKVSCTNMAIAFHIRNFFSKIIYKDFQGYRSTKEFVKYILYNETENLLRKIKHCTLSQVPFQEFQTCSENFEKNIIGALPL